MIALGALGDSAYLARFETEAEAARWVSAVREQHWPGVVDVVLAYQTAAVFADPDRIDLNDLARRLVDVSPTPSERPPGNLIRVPVHYDGDDLPEVARRLGMTESEFIVAHSEPEYQVFAVGFRPGFPYAGYLPDRLSGLPARLAEGPRTGRLGRARGAADGHLPRRVARRLAPDRPDPTSDRRPRTRILSDPRGRPLALCPDRPSRVQIPAGRLDESRSPSPLSAVGFSCLVTVLLSIIHSRSFGSNNETPSVALSVPQSQLIAGESFAQFRSRRRLSGNRRVDATSLGIWYMNLILVSIIFWDAVLLAFALGTVPLLTSLFIPKYAGTPRSDGPSGAWLAGLLTELRKEKNLVGLAAMVMVDGQVVASAADGERKRGSGVPIELGDRWHLGSVSKSITATMIARLVESGQMQWSDSVGERFPEASIHEDWKPVTLRQLLTHTSGAPANFSIWVRLMRPALGPECTQKRREAVMHVIAQKPAHPPGEKYAYSNIGYTIAGAMAETATGVSWEDLVKREVFEPLDLTGVGFGPPKSPSETLDQPRGHRGLHRWKTSARDDEDNTPIMGPAGIVHMTLRDVSTYATEHLRGELGTGKLLAIETYQRIHTPELGDYACGWVRKEPTDKIPHRVYWHNGSNTMWYALAVFIPGQNMTVAVTSNDGDIVRAESAAWAVVEASANQFKDEGDSAPRESLHPGDRDDERLPSGR